MLLFNFQDFQRMIRPIKNKIFLMIGRSILESVNNTTPGQLLNISVLANEALTNVERYQNYGFDSCPLPGAEVLTVFHNGNRDQGAAIVVMDRRYRPVDHSEGESIMYTYLDKTNPHRVHLKADGTIEINSTSNAINTEEDVAIDAGTTITIDAAGIVNITSSAGAVNVNGVGINLDGGTNAVTGCVTNASTCHFYGGLHLDGSTNVKASK